MFLGDFTIVDMQERERYKISRGHSEFCKHFLIDDTRGVPSECLAPVFHTFQIFFSFLHFLGWMVSTVRCVTAEFEDPVLSAL